MARGVAWLAQVGRRGPRGRVTRGAGPRCLPTCVLLYSGEGGMKGLGHRRALSCGADGGAEWGGGSRSRPSTPQHPPPASLLHKRFTGMETFYRWGNQLAQGRSGRKRQKLNSNPGFSDSREVYKTRCLCTLCLHAAGLSLETPAFCFCWFAFQNIL